MSKKDFIKGAETVAKPAGEKLREISEKAGVVKEHLDNLNAGQEKITNEIIDRSDEHEERIQALEDNSNFVRISRNSIDDMSPTEQELLLAWLQKLMVEFINRGFNTNTNQQTFMTNIFKYLEFQDELMQVESLSMLEYFNNSVTHETIYKIYLSLCYLYDNSFSILESVDDIDQMFRLNKSDKQKLREILEKERIPALGISGLVGTFDPARPSNSFKVETMITRYTKMNTHCLLQYNLSSTDCITYMKAFALLAPKDSKLQEQQRNYIGNLADLLGCPESVYEVENLFLTPQQVNIKAWQSVLDTDDKKYAWTFDAAAILALDENFKPESCDLLEHIVKALNIQGTNEIMQGIRQMLTSRSSTELLSGIKQVRKYKINWKHLAEFSNFDFRGMFDSEREKLRELYWSASELISAIGDLKSKTIDDLMINTDSFDDDGIMDKLRVKVAEKILEFSHSTHVKNLKKLWQQGKNLINENLELVESTSSYIKMFSVENKPLNLFFLSLEETEDIEISNSDSQDDWDRQFEKYVSKLEKVLNEFQSLTDFNYEQLGLFEKSKINESLILNWQKATEEREKKELIERKEKASITLNIDGDEKKGKIIWKDISDVPFDKASIFSIATSGTEWGLIADNILYYSEAGEEWEEWVNIEDLELSSIRDRVIIKYVNGVWFIISDSKLFCQKKDEKGNWYWHSLNLPSENYSPKPNIYFFNGQWLLVVKDEAEYSYTKKGVIFNSKEKDRYDAPKMYQCRNLGDLWEEWDEASSIPTGIVLNSPGLGIGKNIIVASFDYDFSYKMNKNMELFSNDAYVAYIGKNKDWKEVTWPENCLISYDSRFYFIDDKWIAVSDSSILVSENAFEWTESPLN